MYSELLDALVASQVACLHRQPRQRDASYARAAFCLDIGHELFDALFNSATGYRGAHFVAPDSGAAANRALLGAVTSMLVEFAIARHEELDRVWVTESLSLPSAKAWLAEDSVALCSSCASGWSTSYVSALHIQNDRWEHSEHPHAVWGRQAPELSKLRVFGGFVNDQHQEWVADNKRDRAQHIWQHGWT